MVVVRWNGTLPKDELGSSLSFLAIRAGVAQLVMFVTASQFSGGTMTYKVKNRIIEG